MQFIHCIVVFLWLVHNPFQAAVWCPRTGATAPGATWPSWEHKAAHSDKCCLVGFCIAVELNVARGFRTFRPRPCRFLHWNHPVVAISKQDLKGRPPKEWTCQLSIVLSRSGCAEEKSQDPETVVERGVREIGEQLNHRNNMEMGYNVWIALKCRIWM